MTGNETRDRRIEEPSLKIADYDIFAFVMLVSLVLLTQRLKVMSAPCHLSRLGMSDNDDQYSCAHSTRYIRKFTANNFPS